MHCTPSGRRESQSQWRQAGLIHTKSSVFFEENPMHRLNTGGSTPTPSPLADHAAGGGTQHDIDVHDLADAVVDESGGGANAALPKPGRPWRERATTTTAARPRDRSVV